MTDVQPTSDKSIGNLIAEANNLTAEQVEQVLSHQRNTGQKFGEAAVDLGLAKKEDVLWALSQQFHYPYAADGRKQVSSELIVATNPFDASAEFFREVRSQVIANVFNRQEPRNALAVCSPNVGDGKSFFAANLAVAFSQLGGRTLLVDADLRTPRQHQIFGMASGVGGLSGVLSGRAETNVIRPIEALPSLYLLPVGVVPPNPLELVQGMAFDMLLNELTRKFDYVIVDTPAAQHGADARVIAAKCGASVALCKQGSTAVRPMEELITSLKKVCSNFAGVIMNAQR
ncbi:MAG: polysaccharide biosynthesis tyrosine autokinase [Burkholderiales bacterium]|nr:polysaccharide biosynthesis tyrosine autokinase [Burkholderiales bacterium]